MSDNDRDHASRASVQKSTVAIVLTGLLLAGYAGLYYATVKVVFISTGSMVPPSRRLSLWIGHAFVYEATPHYDDDMIPFWLPQRVAGFIFAPIHAIDRRIRPGYWDGPPLLPAIPVAPPPLAAPGPSGPGLAP